MLLTLRKLQHHIVQAWCYWCYVSSSIIIVNQALQSTCVRECGRVIYPIALAMYPNVLTVALRMAFLWALSNSRRSKHTLIHSLAETNSAPLSAIRPTRSMQFSCTFSCLQWGQKVSIEYIKMHSKVLTTYDPPITNRKLIHNNSFKVR